MKKVLIALCFTLGLAGMANAQTVKKKEAVAPTESAPSKKGIIIHKKTDGTIDKRFKTNKGLKKDGTTDMRFAKNKKKAA